VTKVESLLREKGPTLSGELIQLMHERDGVSNDAIRQRLSRLKEPVCRLKGIFTENQILFYLKEHQLQPEYYNGLVRALSTAAKRYYAVLTAIQYHQGFIRAHRIASYTFSPVGNLKGHKRIDIILADLLKWDLIRREGEYVATTANAGLNTGAKFRHSKAVELAQSVVLNQFVNWAKSIGLVSYNTPMLEAEFGKLQWGFVAPSYVTGITRVLDQTKPAFVVADVLVGKKANIEDVSFFIRKVDILKNQRNLMNFMPFLLLESVEEDAFRVLKQHGIITAFVSKFFGEAYTHLLQSLIATVTNAGAILKKNPNAYLELLEQIEKLIGGKTNNLRGDLFELAVGYYHSKGQQLTIGRLINHEGKQRELDVLAVYGQQVRIAECKGYKHQLDKPDVENWLSEKVSVIYKWAKDPNLFQHHDIVFELWSTGGFTLDAENYLHEQAGRVVKYKIEFYAEADIMRKAKEARVKRLEEIMREYFIKEI
jgi:hypothetical protein